MQHINLDLEFESIRKQIISHPYFNHLTRHQQIRINSWINKLENITSNNLWRKNRNNYIRMLYLMMDFQEILPPFTSIAPNDIPTIHKHQINCCLLKLAKRGKELGREPTLELKALEEKYSPNCEPLKKKQNLINMSSLSSIPTPLHARLGSNYSQSHNSLQKFLSPHEIKYFSKNRKTQNNQNIYFQENYDPKTYQPLLQRISKFFKNNEKAFENDIEYKELKLQIDSILHQNKHSETQIPDNKVPESMISSIRGGQGISPSKIIEIHKNHMNFKKQNNDFDDIIMDTDEEHSNEEQQTDKREEKEKDRKRKLKLVKILTYDS